MEFMTRLAAALLCGLLALPVFSQVQYPVKPVRLIVPFPPGGSTDVVARAVAQSMDMAQPVFVENRPGAGGTVGMEAAAKADADGHTVVLGTVGTLAAAPSLYRSLGYDPTDSFSPVSLLTKAYLAVAIHASVPAPSLAEFIRLAKSKPGALHLGSPGTGTGPHIAGEMFKQAAGIELVHVPYKGAAPLALDLAAGRVQVALETISTLKPHIESGRIRALAVAAPARLEQLPGVPTASEAGLAGYEFSVWFSLLAPRGTPKEIVARLNQAVRKSLGDAGVRDVLEKRGFQAVSSSPEELAALIRSEERRWSGAIKAAGTRLD
jgi:tripartite-type tricarboxylate transporter receptor subunit TctC